MSNGFSVRGLAVNLGNENLGFGSEVSSDLLPDWGEGLAVWKEYVSVCFLMTSMHESSTHVHTKEQ